MGRRLTRRQIANRANRKKWKGFTEEGMARLRESAYRHRPWEHSTGPRTAAGKERSRRNALVHGNRVLGLFAPGSLAMAAWLRMASPLNPLPSSAEVMEAADGFFSPGVLPPLAGTARAGWMMNNWCQLMLARQALTRDGITLKKLIQAAEASERGPE